MSSLRVTLKEQYLEMKVERRHQAQLGQVLLLLLRHVQSELGRRQYLLKIGLILLDLGCFWSWSF
jgi:hypothetical protein